MIDAHIHLWTDNTVAYPRAASGSEYQPRSFEPEDYFRHSRPAGVSRTVLVQMSFYGYDNSYMLHCMQLHPGMFSGIAVVDTNVPDPGPAMRALADMGVRGFRVHPRGPQDSSWLEQPGMRAMWKCAAREQLAVCPLLNPGNLAALGRMCEQNPDVPVVIDHLARIGADGRIAEEDVSALCGIARYPKVFVKVSAFYALGRKQAPHQDLAPLIQRVFDAFGPRRLMWGSDCPFQVGDGHGFMDSVTLVREGLPFLSATDRDWVLERTAESIFF